jgi:hypothetical protein
MFDVGAMGVWVDVKSEKRRRATASRVADDVKPCASKKGVEWTVRCLVRVQMYEYGRWKDGGAGFWRDIAILRES